LLLNVKLCFWLAFGPAFGWIFGAFLVVERKRLVLVLFRFLCSKLLVCAHSSLRSRAIATLKLRSILSLLRSFVAAQCSLRSHIAHSIIRCAHMSLLLRAKALRTIYSSLRSSYLACYVAIAPTPYFVLRFNSLRSFHCYLAALEID
jgi:hypothetical protein